MTMLVVLAELSLTDWEVRKQKVTTRPRRVLVLGVSLGYGEVQWGVVLSHNGSHTQDPRRPWETTQGW